MHFTIYNFQGMQRADVDAPDDVQLFLVVYDLRRQKPYGGSADIEIHSGDSAVARWRMEPEQESVFYIHTQVPPDDLSLRVRFADPEGKEVLLVSSFELPGEGRFRVNISRQRRFYNIVLRVIPLQIKSFEDLNLPLVLRQISQLRRGYVLVTGATGMGTSTTLATMINEINKARKSKIVTIEDPIEFVFSHDKSVITQREIGTDTDSFPDALRAALRQDPDTIMVGEDVQPFRFTLVAGVQVVAVGEGKHGRADKGVIQRILRAGRVTAHAVHAHGVLLEFVEGAARLDVFLVFRRRIVLAGDVA